jgi:hypothetical protein
MKPATCDEEERALQATRRGRWTDDLARHAVECEVCAEVAAAARFMNVEAASLAADHRLPDPSRIWWRAQLLARREAARRALRPIVVVEQAALACALITIAFSITWGWPIVSGWIGAMTSLRTEAPAAAVAPHALGLSVLADLCLLPVFLALTVLNVVRAGR